MSLILPNKEDSRSHVPSHSLFFLAPKPQVLPRKPFPLKGDDLHIWVWNPHTQAPTDWGPPCSSSRWSIYRGNVAVSFIAFIYETRTRSWVSGSFQAFARHLPFVRWRAGNSFGWALRSFSCPHFPALGQSTPLGQPAVFSRCLLVGLHLSGQASTSAPSTHLAQYRDIWPSRWRPRLSQAKLLPLDSRVCS